LSVIAVSSTSVMATVPSSLAAVAAAFASRRRRISC
jgi:hypothetical protein